MIKLGHRLKAIRLEKGLSLEDVTKATKIRPVFLNAIEKGDYKTFPASSYAHGFVINYAEFLGFSRKEANALFRREFDASQNLPVLPQQFTQKPNFPRIKLQQKALAIGFIFFIFLGFLGFSYRDAFFDPLLIVTTPGENARIPLDSIVTGKTNSYATVTINNAPVAIESTGEFQKKISFFPGKTTITIEATNRFGRQTTIVRTVEAVE